MNIVEKKLKEIKPYEKNARKNDDAVKYVAESIKQFGFKVPIVIDKDNVIVAGHTRYKASKELGLDATSTKAQYTFEKGTHFKATQFVKAVKNANMKGTSYDDAVDKWLKGNAKKYGYKYTKQK